VAQKVQWRILVKFALVDFEVLVHNEDFAEEPDFFGI
jgi:hypothetical protein